MSGLGERPPAIRRGGAGDAEACAAIATLCARQFGGGPQRAVAARPVPPPAVHVAAAERGELFVIEPGEGGGVAGFARLVPAAPDLHVAELDVAPRFQRRGYARALLGHADRLAGGLGLTGLSLTAFTNIAWNAPAYARMGFATLAPEDAPEICRAETALLAALGFAPETRVAMRRPL